MQRDHRCYLWDALRAAESVQAFVRGKTFEAFIEDDLVRSAVERQLQIIGEALSQFAKVDPQIASNVAELRRIIAFRPHPSLPSPGLTRGSQGRVREGAAATPQSITTRCGA